MELLRRHGKADLVVLLLASLTTASALGDTLHWRVKINGDDQPCVTEAVSAHPSEWALTKGPSAAVLKEYLRDPANFSVSLMELRAFRDNLVWPLSEISLVKRATWGDTLGRPDPNSAKEYEVHLNSGEKHGNAELTLGSLLGGVLNPYVLVCPSTVPRGKEVREQCGRTVVFAFECRSMVGGPNYWKYGATVSGPGDTIPVVDSIEALDDAQWSATLAEIQSNSVKASVEEERKRVQADLEKAKVQEREQAAARAAEQAEEDWVRTMKTSAVGTFAFCSTEFVPKGMPFMNARYQCDIKPNGLAVAKDLLANGWDLVSESRKAVVDFWNNPGYEVSLTFKKVR